MGQDYYSVLQITRNSEDAQIKKAYRKLALKNHPLKSSEPAAVETFRQIAEAYDVLSDPVKRGIYDKFGEEGLKGGVPLEFGSQTPWTTGYVFHGNPGKVFHEFFGGDNPFSEFFDAEGNEVDLNFGGLRGRGVKKQDPPIERDLYLSLEDLFFGCTKKIKISRRVLNEDRYSSTIKDKILMIDVKPGWRQGTRITFEKEGDQGPNVIPADIVFYVKEKLHPRFRREKDNLIFVKPIPLGKALTCCTVEVKTLDDRLLNIPINDIVQVLLQGKLSAWEGLPCSPTPSPSPRVCSPFSCPVSWTKDRMPGLLPQGPCGQGVSQGVRDLSLGVGWPGPTGGTAILCSLNLLPPSPTSAPSTLRRCRARACPCQRTPMRRATSSSSSTSSSPPASRHRRSGCCARHC